MILGRDDGKLSPSRFGPPPERYHAQGENEQSPAPCYAWNNTINGQPLRMEVSRRTDLSENEKAQIKKGRDFFNEAPKPEYYKPYTYPHPLQGGP